MSEYYDVRESWTVLRWATKKESPDLHLREMTIMFQDIVHYDPAVEWAQIGDGARAHHELALDMLVYRHRSDGSEVKEETNGRHVHVAMHRKAEPLRAD
jgi:hypothetical protein